jgi:AP endonuclease-1
MPPRRSTSSVKRYRESTSPLTSSEDDAAYTPANITAKTKGARSTTVKTEAVIVEAAVNVGAAAPPAKKPRASKGKISTGDDENYKAGAGGDEAVEEKPKKKTPKAKMWPPPDLDPANHPARSGYPIFTLPSTTIVNGSLNPSVPPRPMLLGAHVSIGGGPATALLRASKAGANGLALFVKNQRSWKSNPYEDEAIQRFRDLMRPKDEGGECNENPASISEARLTSSQGVVNPPAARLFR